MPAQFRKITHATQQGHRHPSHPASPDSSHAHHLLLQYKAQLQELEAVSAAKAQQAQQRDQELRDLTASKQALQTAHQQAATQAAEKLAAAAEEAASLHKALEVGAEQAAQQKASQAELQQQLSSRAQEADSLHRALADSRAAADTAGEAARADKADREAGHRAELAHREQGLLQLQAKFGAAVQQLSQVEGECQALGRKYGKVEAVLLEREHQLERTAAELDEKSRGCSRPALALSAHGLPVLPSWQQSAHPAGCGFEPSCMHRFCLAQQALQRSSCGCILAHHPVTQPAYISTCAVHVQH